MSSKTPASLVRIRVRMLGWLALVCVAASAEQLPIKPYTTAEGLAHNVVNRIVRDSRGFLWFCTREGLSRFDGYAFTTYGLEQGLPSSIVNDLVETRDGVYWVATAGGLCRFNPLGKPRAPNTGSNENQTANDRMFNVYSPGEDLRSKHIVSLLEDRSGSLWCGTLNGLYRVFESPGEVRFAFVDLGISDHLEARIIDCLVEDKTDSMWIGSHSGLFRRWSDGRIEEYTVANGLPEASVHSLLKDRDNRIWVGTTFRGLYQLVPDPVAGRSIVARAYTDKDGLPATWINQIFQTSDGGLWAGSNKGLIQFIPIDDRGDFRFRIYAKAHGLSYHEVASLAEDRNGSLWIGMLGGGAAKIARNGFTLFGTADGLSGASAVFESNGSDVLVVGTPGQSRWFINRYDGEKFIRIRPNFQGTSGPYAYGWGWNQLVAQDHAGEWWIATGNGVCRFPKLDRPENLAHATPKAIYTTTNGLAADLIIRLFEDSRGDIWVSSTANGQGKNGVSRWERRTETLRHYSERDGLPRSDAFYASAFAEDRAGNIWVGFSGDGGLVRYRSGAFTGITASGGVPPGQIRNMLIDSEGRLWIASYRGGLSLIDDPTAERPTLRTYTTADGLSSNEITAVTDDQWGRIYIGTGRGIDRLEPATGRVKHYTTADGLPLGEMFAALRDKHGTLWFSFKTGVARLVPQPDATSAPPPILITGLRIAADTQPISALGEVELRSREIGADKNQLQIDFVALDLSPGEGLLYQYKLEGASDQWSPLADHRTITFANLSPGSYRFLVRATNADGVFSETPASFSFKMLPPVWRRWWFLSLATLLVAIAIYSMFRYRLSQRLRVERVRTHIATDLHDDIGTNLSLIAMASEVALRRSGANDPQLTETLTLISATSRELVDSMGDIVWTINPRRDRLDDLIKRMRRFASDVFSARSIVFHFEAPSDDREVRLRTETRRQVLLIFKEAVSNIARHSRCTAAHIELKAHAGEIVLKMRDNGSGFDTGGQFEGTGLFSMRDRATKIGGTLEVDSRRGDGTTVILEAPIR